MKKILLTFSIISFALISKAQEKVITKKEAKQIAQTINTTVDEMSKTIDKLDWNEMNNLLNNALEFMDKNASSLDKIAKSIDTQKLEKTAEKLASQINKNIDVEKIEKKLSEVADKLEQKKIITK